MARADDRQNRGEASPGAMSVERGELIAALDTDRPEDIAVRVLPLKHMGAVELAKELAPLYQKMNGKSPGTSIDVVADDRSNSLIVLSSEADFNTLDRIIHGLDTA